MKGRIQQESSEKIDVLKRNCKRDAGRMVMEEEEALTGREKS
jgi:hypothetical protein